MLRSLWAPALIISVLTAPAVAETPAEYASALDRLLDASDYRGLSDKIMKETDGTLRSAGLDWGKSRMQAGKSLIVPLIYSMDLWRIGSSNSQYASLKETAGLITLYSLLVTYADGVKCADQSAPGHRVDVIVSQYIGPLKEIAQLPEDRRNLLVNTALAMERVTAPKRENDKYLCRFGLQETTDILKRHEGEKLPEAPPQAGQVGKQIALPYDPDYQPTFLSSDQWESKQAESRAHFPALITGFLTKISGHP